MSLLDMDAVAVAVVTFMNLLYELHGVTTGEEGSPGQWLEGK